MPRRTKHWFQYNGDIYTLRGLCRELKVNYSSAHHYTKDQSFNDYSWVFGQPKGTVLPHKPSKKEIETVYQETNQAAGKNRPMFPEDNIPPAVTQFLTGGRP